MGLNLDLEVDRLYDDVTSGGRLFHVLTAAMGNAWLPVVLWYKGMPMAREVSKSMTNAAERRRAL